MRVYALFSMFLSFIVFVLFTAVTVNAFYEKDKQTYIAGALLSGLVLVWFVTAMLLLIRI